MSLADQGLNDRIVEKGLKAPLARLHYQLQYLSQELTLIKITLRRYREDSLECERKLNRPPLTLCCVFL